VNFHLIYNRNKTRLKLCCNRQWVGKEKKVQHRVCCVEWPKLPSDELLASAVSLLKLHRLNLMVTT
jgi:hypothetical protein